MARLGDVVAFGVQPRTNKQIIGSRASDAMRDFARNPWHRWQKTGGGAGVPGDREHARFIRVHNPYTAAFSKSDMAATAKYKRQYPRYLLQTPS